MRDWKNVVRVIKTKLVGVTEICSMEQNEEMEIRYAERIVFEDIEHRKMRRKMKRVAFQKRNK